MDTVTWNRTWPDARHDFIAERGGRVIMRIYRHPDGRRWQWFCQLTGAQGIEETRDEALAAVNRPSTVPGSIATATPAAPVEMGF